MQRNDPLWLEHLDIITAWGEASAGNQAPPPTRPATVGHIPRPAGSAAAGGDGRRLLAQLRAAFDAGHGPTRIDLDAVAAAVAARGVPARVLHSSGGTATLYTGAEMVDVTGDVRLSASAGPGWFDGPDQRRPFADSDEFGIGPHDDSWASACRGMPPRRRSPTSSWP